LYFFWFFVLPFFQKNTKEKIRQQKRSGTKRHFHLIDDNFFLKQKALDRFTFAWGGAKGFFLEKA